MTAGGRHVVAYLSGHQFKVIGKGTGSTAEVFDGLESID